MSKCISFFLDLQTNLHQGDQRENEELKVTYVNGQRHCSLTERSQVCNFYVSTQSVVGQKSRIGSQILKARSQKQLWQQTFRLKSVRFSGVTTITGFWRANSCRWPTLESFCHQASSTTLFRRCVNEFCCATFWCDWTGLQLTTIFILMNFNNSWLSLIHRLIFKMSENGPWAQGDMFISLLMEKKKTFVFKFTNFQWFFKVLGELKGKP